MSALGFVLIGLGLLTIWSGFSRTMVTDVLRSFIGAPVSPRTQQGALK